MTVKIADASAKATADNAGQWHVSLPAMNAGGPHTIAIAGTNQITLEDVLVGEVWICSGQSNMEMGVGVSLNGNEEVAAADHPQIRFIMVPKLISATPLQATSKDPVAGLLARNHRPARLGRTLRRRLLLRPRTAEEPQRPHRPGAQPTGAAPASSLGPPPTPFHHPRT